MRFFPPCTCCGPECVIFEDDFNRADGDIDLENEWDVDIGSAEIKGNELELAIFSRVTRQEFRAAAWQDLGVHSPYLARFRAKSANDFRFNFGLNTAGSTWRYVQFQPGAAGAGGNIRIVESFGADEYIVPADVPVDEWMDVEVCWGHVRRTYDQTDPDPDYNDGGTYLRVRINGESLIVRDVELTTNIGGVPNGRWSVESEAGTLTIDDAYMAKGFPLEEDPAAPADDICPKCHEHCWPNVKDGPVQQIELTIGQLINRENFHCEDANSCSRLNGQVFLLDYVETPRYNSPWYAGGFVGAPEKKAQGFQAYELQGINIVDACDIDTCILYVHCTTISGDPFPMFEVAFFNSAGVYFYDSVTEFYEKNRDWDESQAALLLNDGHGNFGTYAGCQGQAPGNDHSMTIAAL